MRPKTEFLTLTFAIHVKVRFVTVTKVLDKVIILLRETLKSCLNTQVNQS